MGLKVYIAAPYTKGDVGENVHKSIVMQNNLRAMGYTPFNPLLTHFCHLIIPHTYEYWMSYDVEWLYECDVVFRMEGESDGADREVLVAKKNDIPVVTTFSELFEVERRLGGK